MITSSEVLVRLDPHVRGLLRELERIWDAVAEGTTKDATPGSTPSAPRAAYSWVELEELQNQTDIWPKPGGGKDVAVFERFRVFERDDGLRVGLGHRRRDDGHTEIGVFLLGSGEKKRLVVYFQPTDDFASTGKMFAPIRGKNGGRTYFRGTDTLPPDYAKREIAVLGHVAPKHRLGKIAVVLADADDWLTMVEHAASQVRLRNLTV